MGHNQGLENYLLRPLPAASGWMCNSETFILKTGSVRAFLLFVCDTCSESQIRRYCSIIIFKPFGNIVAPYDAVYRYRSVLAG